MSDEQKKLKFKTTTQEIKFRGNGGYKARVKQEIEEHAIPENNLDRETQDKIPLILENTDRKLLLEEDKSTAIPLFENNEKIAISEGNDSQSLDKKEVTELLDNEEQKENKTLNLPLSKRKSYKTKTDSLPNSEPEVKVDYSKRTNTTSLNSFLPNQNNNPTDSSQEKTSEVTRHSYKSYEKKEGKSKSTWGQSSFGKKKSVPKKNEQTLEEEEKGIYRTSTLKKPKRKPKEIVDEEGYVRSSAKPAKQYASRGKKEYVYNEEKLYNYGINRLSEQDYGRHELLKKMKNLQEDEEMINRVLDKLEGQKFLNDNNRIRSFLMSYSNSESVNKTKQRLIQKGFDKKNIEAVLDDMENSGIYKAIQDKETEEEKALALLIRRYRIYEVEKKEKMSRFLASKGFNFDIISKVMKTFSNGEFDSFNPY